MTHRKRVKRKQEFPNEIALKNFEGYFATRTGYIYSSKSHKILKPIENSGYFYANLWSGSKYKLYAIHRLVCTAYHGEGGSLHVNHINGIKSDNRPENLEWCTQKENNHKAWETGIAPRIADFNIARRKAVIAKTVNGEICESYESIREAARHGFSGTQIHRCIRNPEKVYCNRLWEVVE